MLALLLLAPTVTLQGLLEEMSDRSALARWPAIEYASLQASSYNRESVHRDKPGWFADSDGVGYIRQDANGEYVLMEHDGPGAITKIWTPFFYYDFNERRGPNVRIYLDGAKTPVVDESLIELVSGKGTIKPPFAAFSARAGNSYMPIPFGKSCRVTMKEKPFYNLISYRAYPKGTRVETFSPGLVSRSSAALGRTQKLLTEEFTLPVDRPGVLQVAPGQTVKQEFKDGPLAFRYLKLELVGADLDPSLLRSTVISGTFDGIETIWCPIGEFFSNSDGVRPYKTWNRQVKSKAEFTTEWVMPYKKEASFSFTNYGSKSVTIKWQGAVQPWKWDDRSMHFYARWRPDDIVPGTPVTDWNFIDIRGRGVYVGDSWTVLNKRKDSWWGEGDEKIYVDGAWEKGFPTHFGTGTEDYYGWAGGVYPDLKDEFSQPFLANVKVGGLDGHTMGYNICTRVRSLDAIPFKSRLQFDMESSFGTDMRTTDDRLGYTATTFFYAFPGAKHNRPASPKEARKRIMALEDLRRSPGSKNR